MDKTTGLPWIPPRKGTALIHIQYECDIPSRFNIGDQKGISYSKQIILFYFVIFYILLISLFCFVFFMACGKRYDVCVMMSVI